MVEIVMRNESYRRESARGGSQLGVTGLRSVAPTPPGARAISCTAFGRHASARAAVAGDRPVGRTSPATTSGNVAIPNRHSGTCPYARLAEWHRYRTLNVVGG